MSSRTRLLGSFLADDLGLTSALADFVGGPLGPRSGLAASALVKG